ncbi:MAG: Cof-type HAD-IIB family hydrolase [Christensenellaceae bacterium]|jgi:Cof subfamily protein (haloacid dehalogenase superfamily)|nr:Cof-type HAD-IIB family hydrolase [Christensenellaceae bacterium]
MPIQLIAFDYDDTLLADDRTISDENISAIEYARAKGVKIVPASGRAYSSMLPYTKLFGGFDAMVATNGSQVYDASGKRLQFISVARELVPELTRFAAEEGAYLQLYDDELFLFERDCGESQLYARLAGLQGRAVGPFSAFPLDFDMPKLLFIELDPGKMAALRQKAQARFGQSLAIENSKSMYLEVTNPAATKGSALRFLSGHFGIPLGDMMAIGDSGNDLPMIELAGVGVAVGNARGFVKEKADFISAPSSDSGLGKAIRRFV